MGILDVMLEQEIRSAPKIEESKTVALFPDLTVVNIDKFPKETELWGGLRLIKFDGSLLLSESLKFLGVEKDEIHRLKGSSLALEIETGHPDENFLFEAGRLSAVMRMVKPVITIPVQISYRGKDYYEVTAMKTGPETVYRFPYEHRLPKESHLHPEDIDTVSKFWRCVAELRSKQGGKEHKLLKSIDFSEASYKQGRVWLRLVLLVTALESLFTTSNEGVSYTLRSRVAKFLGGDEGDRKKVFDFTGRMYKIRSGIVHGGVPKELLDKKIIEDVVELENLLRSIHRKILSLDLVSHFENNKTAERYLDEIVLM